MVDTTHIPDTGDTTHFPDVCFPPPDTAPTYNNSALLCHTRGPWLVGLNHEIYATNPGGFPVLIAIAYGFDPMAEGQATGNANLIAAAPDLLEALLNSLQYLSNDQISACGIYAALAKAGGKT